MARKLASIRTITSLEPIEGKDRIELATVDGWKVIVKKGEFRPGDPCVYIEIDSVLPDKPEFEFLRSKNFRIKTMKMGGVISQGICFPLSILKQDPISYQEGQDVTEELGIIQYVPTMDDPQAKETAVKNAVDPKYPAWLMRWKWFRKLVLPKKEAKGFPSFISKTDEVKVQNIPWILKDKTTRWIATSKLDGASASYVLLRHKSKIPFVKDKFEFMVCSRNFRRFTPDDSYYWKIAKKYQLELVLHDLIGDNEWVCIQGECVGPGIQGNKYGLKDYDMYVFNLIYPYGRKPSLESKVIVEERGLKHVPLLFQCTMPDTVDEVLRMAHGESRLGNTIREGIVFRSIDGKQSFKAVDPEFLLRYGE